MGLNRAPEITSTGPFEVEENTARVGQLQAVDWDEEDEVTGYGIAGGADGALFGIEAETGELSFREAPDYENPADVESGDPQSGAADNEYILVVEVTSGEGERVRRREQAIRVRVTDQEMEEAGEGETGEDPSDFTEGDLEGRSLTLRVTGGEGVAAEALSCGSEKASASTRKPHPGPGTPCPDPAATPISGQGPA